MSDAPPDDPHRVARAVAMAVRGLQRAVIYLSPSQPPRLQKPNRKARRAALARAQKKR